VRTGEAVNELIIAVFDFSFSNACQRNMSLGLNASSMSFQLL